MLEVRARYLIYSPFFRLHELITLQLYALLSLSGHHFKFLNSTVQDLVLQN